MRDEIIADILFLALLLTAAGWLLTEGLYAWALIAGFFVFGGFACLRQDLRRARKGEGSMEKWGG